MSTTSTVFALDTSQNLQTSTKQQIAYDDAPKWEEYVAPKYRNPRTDFSKAASITELSIGGVLTALILTAPIGIPMVIHGTTKVKMVSYANRKRIFDEKAKKSGLNKSEFFRKIILDYKLKEQPDERFYEILSQLRGMANNLNQMARTYNRYQGYMREDKFTPLLQQIRDLVLSLEQVYLLPQKKGTLYGNNKTMEI